MVVCKFWQQGNCRFGNSCKFEHPIAHQNQNRFGAFGAPSGHSNALTATQKEPENEYNITSAGIVKDLTEERPQWIFSAYGPGRNAPEQLFGGPQTEQSFEELRLHHLKGTASGNPQAAMRDIDSLCQQIQQQMENAIKNPLDAMRFVLDAQNRHPNRQDICQSNSLPSTTGEFAVGRNQPGQQGNVFGSTQTAAMPSLFGKPAGSGPFGAPATSAFGQPGGSVFGRPAQLNAGSSFGQPSQLGATSGMGGAFGRPAQQGATAGPAFGQPSQPAAAPSAFGQPSQPGSANVFGKPSQPTPSAFGQPAFGQPSNPGGGGGGSAFGQPTAMGGQQRPAFGASPFGQPAASGFSKFAQPAATSGNAFGQPSQPGQGAGGSGNVFGQSAFGQASGLGKGPSPFAAAAGNTASPFAAAQNGSATAGTNPPNPFSRAAPAAAAPASGFAQASTGVFGAKPANPFGTAAASTPSPFGQSSTAASTGAAAPANPFQKSTPAVNPFSQPSGPSMGGLQSTSTNSGAANRTGMDGPGGPEAERQHPALSSYAVSDASGNLIRFKGQTVTYQTLDGVSTPAVSNPQGRPRKIWFPKGPPAYNKDTELAKEAYTNDVLAKYDSFMKTGKFEGGLMPELPPRREWCLWDF